MNETTVVLLSGGSGTRLWPISRELLPKQLLALPGAGQTMLQSTLLRCNGISSVDSYLVICNEQHRFMVTEQLHAIRSATAALPVRIILETVGRNTAPAIAFAAHNALEQSPLGSRLLLVLPADHVISDELNFRGAVERALPLARRGLFVTFGVTPNRPETGYGYIVRGNLLERTESQGAYEISRFVEKPEKSLAETLIAEGNCYWNSGIFLFSASIYLDALSRHAPDIAQVCESAWSKAKVDDEFIRPDPQDLSAVRADSIDYAVMEKVENIAVVPLSSGWSDVGSWSSIHDTLGLDEKKNAFYGDVISVDTENTLVISESRLVATLGLSGYAVIETKDAVLVSRKDRVQDVKRIVARLKADGRNEHSLHREVYRPWGSYDGLEQGPGYQVKRLMLKPGAAISLQLHHHRSEHWIIVAGQAQVTRGEDVFELSANESTYIPAGVKHRLENIGTSPLRVIEVQSGSYLGEDDIIRFDDRYGRGVG